MAGKVLIVATSFNGHLGDAPTGSWVEEIASPYYAFRSKGLSVDIASVKGGAIPFDAASTSGDFLTQEASRFQNDVAVQQLVQETKSVEQVLVNDVEQYDAVFLPGGHGIVFDGEDASLKRLVDGFWARGKVVSAVCHGPCGLVTATAPDGKPIVSGKKVAGFSNTEEIAVGKDKLVPFLLEDRLKELGGLYERGDDWSPYAVRDGNLVTGQNPQSSKAVAELVIEALLPGSELQHGKKEGFHHRGKPVTREHHHDHQDNHPVQGARSDVSHHPQKERSQWHSPVRQASHTESSTRGSRHPDCSYNA